MIHLDIVVLSFFILSHICVDIFASLNPNQPDAGFCPITNICRENPQILKCKKRNSRIFLRDVTYENNGNSSCKAIDKFYDACDNKKWCSTKMLQTCCHGINPSVTVDFYCIKASAVDTECQQTSREPVHAIHRHIYPNFRKSDENPTITKSVKSKVKSKQKSKPPFCQWRIIVPTNSQLVLKINRLYTGKGNCNGKSSLIMQYGVTKQGRAKYQRDVPTCVQNGNGHVIKMSESSLNVLVWFTPISKTERLWLSFEIIPTRLAKTNRFVMANSTSCFSSPAPTPSIPLRRLPAVTSQKPEKPVNPGNPNPSKQQWTSEKMAYIAAIAAVGSVALIFLVISIILCCKLHRLRYLSKGFSRLRKIPGAGIDLVTNRRDYSEKSDHLVGDRNNYENKLNTTDYRNNDTTIYSVAKRQTLDDEAFLRQMESASPTYAVPYEGVRKEPNPVTYKPNMLNVQDLKITDNGHVVSPHSNHNGRVDLTDDMFKGAKTLPSHMINNDWLQQDNFDESDVIDIRGQNTVPLPPYYRQSASVENALYDSPDDETY